MHLIRNITYVFTVVTLIVSCDNETFESPSSSIDIDDVIELPQVFINTNGQEIVDEPKILADMTITTDETVNFVGKIGIEIRGSSSQFFPKKQFGIETRDDTGEDIDVAILEFPEEEDWILNAPYSDKTLFRNVLIYDLSRDIGRYASRVEFVELTINDLYNGIYVFMEKLKRDENRIDINKLKEDENSGEDVTGGYILKIDKADGANETIYTDFNAFASNFTPNGADGDQKIYFNYDYPKAEKITLEQRTYISTYINDFETALYDGNFADMEEGYANYIDVNSFIEFFILNELANNVDGYRLSTWLTKEKNEKLKMGPIWDFNLAFGNANYCGGENTNVWAYKFNDRCPNDFWLIPFWWEKLMEDPAFVMQLKDRWFELRSGQLSNNAIQDKIDFYETILQSSLSIDRNFNRWPILSTYIWPNNFIGNTYEEELRYLREFIETRVTWLDINIADL